MSSEGAASSKMESKETKPKQEAEAKGKAVKPAKEPTMPKTERVIMVPTNPRSVAVVWAGFASFLVLAMAVVFATLRIPLEMDTVKLESGKTYVVVGCAPGNVEMESALLLLERGATTVICTAENEANAEVVKAATYPKKFDGVLVVDVMDSQSFESVENFARKINQRPGFVDGVTLGSGIYTTQKQLTKDGFDAMYQVNFLSQFLLLRRIEGKFANDVRVVFHSSLAYLFDGHFSKQAYSKKPGGRNLTDESLACHHTFADTKLFQILAAKEYAARWHTSHAGTNASFNAVCPGIIGPIPPASPREGLFGMVKYYGKRVLERTPREGAIQGVMIQTSPKYRSVNGAFSPSYFNIPLSQIVKRNVTSAALWAATCELLGVPVKQEQEPASAF